MQITRTFERGTYEISSHKLCAFWEDLGYKMSKKTETQCIGQRGRIIHNFYTCDMRKLPTLMTMNISDSHVHVMFDVNTVGQMITKTEKDLWHIEFELFDALLNNYKMNTDLIADYERKIRKLAIGIWSTLLVLLALITTFFIIFIWP
jgi:hypothetical protein